MLWGFTEAQFAHFGLIVGVGGLVLYLFFIIWRMAKESRAGYLGTAIMFLALGLGVVGYIFKEVMVWWLS